MIGDTPYEEALTERLTSACIPAQAGGPLNESAIIEMLEKWRVNYLVLQTPARRVLDWALKSNIRTFPLFADSWEENSLRGRIRGYRLAKLLNKSRVPMVGNHNIPASLSLKKIGVKPEKIFPWDWPHEHTPDKYAVKECPKEKAPLLFVGQISEAKGVGDCLDAAAILKKEGVDFHWRFIGGGDFEERARKRVKDEGLSNCVEIAGKQSHDAVIAATKAAAVSIVPSRHIYPEGLPMTIYEALATRTPLVLSNHPMFRSFFSNTPAAQMVEEKSPDAIAASIKSLLSDEAQYTAASEATGALWHKVRVDVTWGTLIERWIDSPRRPAQSIMNKSLLARLGG